MLRNKGVVYLSFHLSKSDVKAHDIHYSESLVFSWSCYFAFIGWVVRLVHIVVHCENMNNVQLLSQILFSRLRSFKRFCAAVEWFIIVGRIQ